MQKGKGKGRAHDSTIVDHPYTTGGMAAAHHVGVTPQEDRLQDQTHRQAHGHVGHTGEDGLQNAHPRGVEVGGGGAGSCSSQSKATVLPDSTTNRPPWGSWNMLTERAPSQA